MHLRFLLLFLITAHLGAQVHEAVGPQRTAVIFIDHLEDAEEPSVDLFHEAIFGENESVNNFIKEVSHQKTWLTGKSYPWLRLRSLGRNCYLSGEEILSEVIKQKLFDPREVDRLLVINHLSFADDCVKKNSFGFSTLGKENFSTSIGTVRLSLAQFWAKHRFVLPVLPVQPLAGISSPVIAHELGHSLGLRGHANILDCGDKTISFERKECTQSAVADMFSLMGGEGFYRPALHFAACHKADLGWLSEKDGGIIVLKKTGKSQKQILKMRPFSSKEGNTIRIDLETPIPVPCVNPVNCQVSIQSLFLEYRTASGFDSNLKNLENHAEKFFGGIIFDPQHYSSSNAIDTKGIQIRGGFYKDNYCVTSYGLDVKPQSLHARNRLTNEIVSYSLYDSLDSFLLPGEQFEEPVNGLNLRVIQIDNEGNALVEIRY